MSAKHTAPSYQVREEDDSFDIGAWTDEGTVTVAVCAKRADAEFIARACNFHDRLVSQIKSLLGCCEFNLDEGVEPETQQGIDDAWALLDEIERGAA